MKMLKPPSRLDLDMHSTSIFLAGSIEMGKAKYWQDWLASQLEAYEIILFNPRRDNWDSSWQQSIDNPIFKEQVDWELTGLENATYRVFHFEAGTKSPITLMELGICKDMENTIVHCPEGFWRKGNVDIVCERYGILQVESLQAVLDWLIAKLANP